MRPSMMCVLFTPPLSAVTHASTFGSIPLEIAPDFTISSIWPVVRCRHLTTGQIDEMVKSGAISSGMLPKVEACVTALKGGVNKTHIIDGRIPHALLLEIYTEAGIGTEIVR